MSVWAQTLTPKSSSGVPGWIQQGFQLHGWQMGSLVHSPAWLVRGWAVSWASGEQSPPHCLWSTKASVARSGWGWGQCQTSHRVVTLHPILTNSPVVRIHMFIAWNLCEEGAFHSRDHQHLTHPLWRDLGRKRKESLRVRWGRGGTKSHKKRAGLDCQCPGPEGALCPRNSGFRVATGLF